MKPEVVGVRLPCGLRQPGPGTMAPGMRDAHGCVEELR